MNLLSTLSKQADSDTNKRSKLTDVRKTSPVKQVIMSILAPSILQEMGQDLQDIENKLAAYTRSGGGSQDVDERDTVSYGLEDGNGGIIKVTVPKDQARSFERALQSFISQDEFDEKDSKDIAEILFNLRNQFTILDVTWPNYYEDEETEQTAIPSSDEENVDSDVADNENNIPADDELPSDDSDLDVPQATQLLTQIINMMTADAAARAKEAEARGAEAQTKQQYLNTQNIIAKVKQEEQILDMEADMKAKKEQERETKRLAQLAHWSSEINKAKGTDDGSPDDGTGINSNIPTPAIRRPSITGQEDEQQARPVARTPGMSKQKAASILTKIAMTTGAK